MDDFDKWNILKKKVDYDQKEIPYFKEGEIWWCSIGKNTGIESNGKSAHFSRPVLIIKKHNKKHCLAIPLTTQKKYGRFYVYLKLNNKDNYLVISQIKTLDSRRLLKKISKVNSVTFSNIKKAIIELNFQ